MLFDSFVLLDVKNVRSTHRSYPVLFGPFVLVFADFLWKYPGFWFSGYLILLKDTTRYRIRFIIFFWAVSCLGVGEERAVISYAGVMLVVVSPALTGPMPSGS